MFRQTIESQCCWYPLMPMNSQYIDCYHTSKRCTENLCAEFSIYQIWKRLRAISDHRHISNIVVTLHIYIKHIEMCHVDVSNIRNTFNYTSHSTWSERHVTYKEHGFDIFLTFLHLGHFALTGCDILYEIAVLIKIDITDWKHSEIDNLWIVVTNVVKRCYDFSWHKRYRFHIAFSENKIKQFGF